MVDSECSQDNSKSLKISFGSVTKNAEKLRFASDHFKAKKMCKHAVQILFYDRYKTKEMNDKATLENGGTLKSVPYCCKSQKMCNKAVD